MFCLNVKTTFLKVVCYGIALGYVNHSDFEVWADRELKKVRHHNRRKRKEITSGKRKEKAGRKKEETLQV